MTDRLAHLPVLVISAHNRCNCRCGMCDIWRNTESRQFTAADLERQLNDIGTLGVQWVVFTGGEALMNSELFAMARTLRAAGVRVTVLTSGLLLGRYAKDIVAHVDDVIVSLDGPRGVHDRIRGVIGAFDQLAGGLSAIRALAPEYPISARCTVQKANHAALLDTALAACSLGLTSISFLAVDVGSDAFNHAPDLMGPRSRSLLLTHREIHALDAEIRRLLADPVRAIVVESREKLQRLVKYFRALAGGFDPEAPVCNAPWVSAVLDSDGSVRPCFFHPPIASLRDSSLIEAINSERALAFRRNLDVPNNPICRRCVCSLHRPIEPEFAEVLA
jgi:MoaA/NifB/PqqE/SkfB family radical SAM enzyme